MATSEEINRKNRRKGEEEYLKLSPEEREKRNKEEIKFNKEHGIDLIDSDQKHHILVNQKQAVLKRKGRGKKKHLSKKAKKLYPDKNFKLINEQQFYNFLEIDNRELVQKTIAS